LNSSVATTPTGRAEIAPAVLAVQDQRLPQLLDTVAAAARCATVAAVVSPDDWFRGEGEPINKWRHRRKKLLAVCAACPVRAACEEAALRQKDGSDRATDDMVRGGHTAAELYAARLREAGRLAAAAEEDDRARHEEQQLRALAADLRVQFLANDQPHNAAKHNRELRATVAQIASVRTARRVRARWSSAA
jgi:WhiB family redox-sensing transcriptional regulator